MRKSYLFTFLGALIYASGYPNIHGFLFSFGPLIGHTLFFYHLFKTESFKHKILLSIFYGACINFMGFYWIGNTLIEFGELPFIIAYALSSFFSFIVLSYLWPLLFILWLLRKYKKTTESKLFESPYAILAFSFLLTFLEYFFPQQFDLFLGQALITLRPFIGLAPFGGVILFSFISYLIVFTVIRYLLHQRKTLSPLIVTALFIILNIVLKIEPTPSSSTQVRLVQPNITSWLKVNAETGETYAVSSVLNRYLDLSRTDSDQELDLIIWPETAYPFGINYEGEETFVPSLFQEIQNKHHAQILFGGYDVRPTQSRYESEYNSAFLLNQEGRFQEVYHKKILIPFGESLPFGPLNKFIAPYIANMAFFKVGENYPLFKLENGHRFITIICYEYLKPRFVLDYFNHVDYPDFIINITNDSWYSFPEQEQHLYLGQWRALEFQRPVIRSTNTGISTILLPNGDELKRLENKVKGVLDVELPIYKTKPTLYSQFGFLITLFVGVLCFLFSKLLIKLKYETF
jgi:apolipoprotein N-acyltransferase